MLYQKWLRSWTVRFVYKAISKIMAFSKKYPPKVELFIVTVLLFVTLNNLPRACTAGCLSEIISASGVSIVPKSPRSLKLRQLKLYRILLQSFQVSMSDL